jgi:flagellar assembly protein FliH
MSSSAEFVPAGFTGRPVKPAVDGQDFTPQVPLSRTATDTETLTGLDFPELRTGRWTRFGDRSALGDEVTESILGGIAEQVRAAAEAQGYAVGWAQGRREAEAAAAAATTSAERSRREAEARREAEHAAAMATLARAADEVRDLLAGLCRRVESQATALAWAVTESLVDREVRSVTGPDVVRRVLSVLPPTPTCTVRMHPDLIGSAAVADLYDRGVEVVADRSLGPADAVVSADGTVIDLRVSEALERVREVLAD